MERQLSVTAQLSREQRHVLIKMFGDGRLDDARWEAIRRLRKLARNRLREVQPLSSGSSLTASRA